MGNLILDKGKLDCSTAISNCFIDHYMPGANGEFVKLYIYLVRCASFTNVNLSLEKLADTFTCTEGDITRALRYWENLGLLSLTTEENSQEITGISLEDCFEAPDSEADFSQATASPEAIAPEEPHQTTSKDNLARPAADSSSMYVPPARMTYTAEDICARKNDEEVEEILCIAQAYLGKTLSVPEMNTLLYFYDSLGFSVELIDYLIEYCTGKNKKSMRYIESVALAWDKEGITTVTQAKANTLLTSKLYYPVMKSMGILDRGPGNKERDYITKWNTTFGFSTEMIIEACNRTINTIHKPSFQYADSILNSWKNSGIRRMEDIQRADKEFKNKELVSKLKQPKIVTNAFANFEQHNRDFSDLDKKLLATRH